VAAIVISEEKYRDKVYACWLGKNIGGTLGAPVEGQKKVHEFTFYDPFPDKSAPNDDLDFQLVWLQMVKERGPHIRVADFADYWKKYLVAYPWNEYGFCQRNLARGLMPPITGCFENYFVDEMGSPIRSEIWACLAPGDPQTAAAFAWKDSALDHAGGEGMHGEMFWAAVESAAFVVADPLALIRVGLAMIPLSSQVSRVVREAAWCWQNGASWRDARERLLAGFGHSQPCHAVQSIGFTVIGWLYGKDYGDKLCAAVNCGYDTDCSGATLGSLLGILGGTAGVPAKWRDPIGEEIVLHPLTRNLPAQKTLSELTEQTVALGKKFLRAHSDCAEIGKMERLPDDLISLLSRNERAVAMLERDIQAATVPAALQGHRDGGPSGSPERAGEDVEITLHYGGEPVLHPGVARRIGVTVERDEVPVEASVELACPPGWNAESVGQAFTACRRDVGAERCSARGSSGAAPLHGLARDDPPAGGLPYTRLGQARFWLRAAQVSDKNTIGVQAKVDGEEYRADFVMLGPGEAKGYPCRDNVPGCAKCGSRIEACTCPR
jgi:ADP-ribosylglycohydrolase